MPLTRRDFLTTAGAATAALALPAPAATNPPLVELLQRRLVVQLSLQPNGSERWPDLLSLRITVSGWHDATQQVVCWYSFWGSIDPSNPQHVALRAQDLQACLNTFGPELLPYSRIWLEAAVRMFKAGRLDRHDGVTTEHYIGHLREVASLYRRETSFIG